MTTLERLDQWKADGIINDQQHVLLASYVRHERFSVFVELSALLYVGVLSVIAGLTWTFRDYLDRLGDIAILSILVILMTAAFGYCFLKTAPYSNDEVDAPTFAFDYVLYFACLVFSSTLAFVETRFAVFQGWDTHLLIAALVFGALAYRFDNRFVLSLAMSTLAAFIGLRLSLFDEIRTDALRLMAIMYGGLLLGAGYLLWRQRIKPHFLDVYLQLGANVILLATASGAIGGSYGLIYLLALVMLAALSILLGIRFRRFAFVAYGTVYGYAGISLKFLDLLRSPTLGLAYLVVTGSIVVMTLVVVARRFGRDEQ
jgi:predicted membrane protein DUF2157